MRLSTSRVNTNRRCGLRYRWQYVDKLHKRSDLAAIITDPALESQRIGTAVHATLERVWAWFRRTRYDGRTDTADILGRTHATAKQSAEQNLLAGAAVGEVIDQSVDHVVHTGRIRGGDILGVEHFAQFTFFDNSGRKHQWIGYMDRAERRDHTVRVTDLKTRRRMPDESELRSDLQATGYSVAAVEQWPWARRVEFAVVNTRLRRETVIGRDRDELDWARSALASELGDDVDQMMSSHVVARTGPWCASCPFVRVCPARDADFGPPANATLPDEIADVDRDHDQPTTPPFPGGAEGSPS